jgi:hypothetical protein
MTSSSVELWQSVVDAFATLHDGVHRNWVVERAKYPDFPENGSKNALLATLDDGQRRVLAEMLVDARRGGVHDALVVLHDRLALNDGKYTERGIAMEFMPYGHTLYQDYVARQAGDSWRDLEDA